MSSQTTLPASSSNIASEAVILGARAEAPVLAFANGGELPCAALIERDWRLCGPVIVLVGSAVKDWVARCRDARLPLSG